MFIDSTTAGDIGPGVALQQGSGANSTFDSSCNYETCIDALRNELHSLRPPDHCLPFYKRIPVIWAPFMSRRRLVQLIVFAGNESKSGLIQETSQHILVDALLLTISTTPVLIAKEVTNLMGAVVLAAFYFTMIVQLCALVSGVIWITVFEQIKAEIFQEWAAQRIPGLLIYLRVHSLGFYCFLVSMTLWPICTHSYPFNLVVAVPGLLFLTSFVCLYGPLGGEMLRFASPGVQLSHAPRDTDLRRMAEGELDLLERSYFEQRRCREQCEDPAAYKEIKEIFKLAKLDSSTSSRYLQAFISQNILTVAKVDKLLPSDYSSLNVSIGDRIAIQDVVTQVKQIPASKMINM